MSSVVQHLPAQNRYLFEKDDKQVGLIDYTMHGNTIVLLHSEIDPEQRHSGLGDEMVEKVLDTIRTETDFRMIPECPFVADWIERHPDYEDLEVR
jgi:predicted GNAT family acetyltransferase